MKKTTSMPQAVRSAWHRIPKTARLILITRARIEIYQGLQNGTIKTERTPPIVPWPPHRVPAFISTPGQLYAHTPLAQHLQSHPYTPRRKPPPPIIPTYKPPIHYRRTPGPPPKTPHPFD